DGSSSHARAVIGEMEAQFEQFRAADVPWSGACVLQPPIRRNIKLAEAPSFGKTIFDYAPACPGARDYRELARGLLERWGLSTDAFDGGPVRRMRAARRAAPRSESKPASAPARKSKRASKGTPKPAPRSKSRSAAKPSSKSKPVPKRATKPTPAPKRVTKPKPRPSKPAAKPARAPKASRRARAGRGRIRSGGLSL
ncbi:MAG: hypothetical protein ACKOQW_02320, partial [Phycisphaerales bacterium]